MKAKNKKASHRKTTALIQKLRDIKRDISFFNEEMSLADIWETLMKNRRAAY